MDIDWIWVWHAGVWLADGIERYQTLLAAVLAIIAAKIAVKPVWAQVVATNTQTQIAHLDTLQKLLSEALLRTERVQKDFSEPLRDLRRCLYDPRGDAVQIDGQTAHYLGHRISGALRWYLETLAGTESGQVEEAKSALKAALDDFEATIGTLEWIETNDQSGDDYAYTDSEWAEMLATAEVASKEASTKGSMVSRAYTNLCSAQAEAIRHLRSQIRNIEQALAKLA